MANEGKSESVRLKPAARALCRKSVILRASFQHVREEVETQLGSQKVAEMMTV